MKSKFPFFKTATLCTVCLIPLNESSWAMEKGAYDIGEDWEKTSVGSRGISSAASSSGGKGGYGQEEGAIKLDALPEIRKYMFKGFLEITPDNIEGFLQHSDVYATSFSQYDRGVFVKHWKSSLGTERLLELLLKFTHINKFRLGIVWDQPDVDVSE